MSCIFNTYMAPSSYLQVLPSPKTATFVAGSTKSRRRKKGRKKTQTANQHKSFSITAVTNGKTDATVNNRGAKWRIGEKLVDHLSILYSMPQS